MEKLNVYRSIAERTDGDVYIGIVGPVRTGKSTFIKRFMDTMVLPHMEEGPKKDRATDELPQSSAGKTIMTTEPKFIPEEAAVVKLSEGEAMRLRLVDCVGYMVPGALGHLEGDGPRMVLSPWYEESVPFDTAAETGTQKVIKEHSTVGIVVTTDGSVTGIPRASYIDAERRVVEELRAIGKPFMVLLNCLDPESRSSKILAEQLTADYSVPVLPVNCLEMGEEDMASVLETLSARFPICEMRVKMPGWIASLPRDHWLRRSVYAAVRDGGKDVLLMSDAAKAADNIAACEYLDAACFLGSDLGAGIAEIRLDLKPELFYRVLGETTGIDISDEADLMPCISELAEIKKKYMKFKDALEQVSATGYGVVMPSIDELRLEEPEIIRQSGKYGVKLKASAPSIHMIAADITTEVNPLVGSEKQSEELVVYLLREFEEDPIKIWQSNIFGKSLNELVNEGLQNKLYRMPQEARQKLQETLERIINDGCSGLICIIL